MNRIVERIGMDKMAHFGIGGLITALVTIVFVVRDIAPLAVRPWLALFYPLAGTVVTVVVSVIKEKAIDSEADWKDMYAALIGSALVFVAVSVGVLFCTGGN